MTTMPMQQVMMMANAILSDALVKSSEIDSLTVRRDGLSDAVDFWNRLMLWGLGVAAIAAVWIVLTTRLAVVRSQQLSAAQGELDLAKDRQLQSDLKAKDLEIAGLTFRADVAEREISIAQDGAAQASQKAAEATMSAESERIERLKLEAQIAPRRISSKQQTDIILACSSLFNKGHWLVRVSSYTLDAEGTVFAGQIVSVLRRSGIAVTDGSAGVGVAKGIDFGVSIIGSDPSAAARLSNILSSQGGIAISPLNPVRPVATIGVSRSDEAGRQPNIEIIVGVKPLDTSN